MPIRAADLSVSRLLVINSYPRIIDFPLHNEYEKHAMHVDAVNIDDELIRHRTTLIYNIPSDSGALVICRYVSNIWDISAGISLQHVYYEIKRWPRSEAGYSTSFVNIKYANRPSHCLDKFIDGVLYVSGAPFSVNANSRVVLEDRSQLSCLFGWSSKLAPLPGWTRVRVKVDDVYTMLAGYIRVHDWVMNNNYTRVRDDIFLHTRVTYCVSDGSTLNICKVTNDETGRGYVQYDH